MDKFVLWSEKVWKVVREDDYFGSPAYLVLQGIGGAVNNFKVVNRKRCDQLDPALNILFERKNDG
ncbi:MAG: hypothetical protein EBR82_30515 [Caulobacteraceae bacterium]|nr:hypothetical protein [Caulobacteraceae bacterium]